MHFGMPVVHAWVELYVERWLKAPMMRGRELVSRTQGMPQGGVVSSVLFNLYMHYAFDTWMARHFPGTLFVRYADAGLVHCKSAAEARRLQEASCTACASSAGARPKKRVRLYAPSMLALVLRMFTQAFERGQLDGRRPARGSHFAVCDTIRFSSRTCHPPRELKKHRDSSQMRSVWHAHPGKSLAAQNHGDHPMAFTHDAGTRRRTFQRLRLLCGLLAAFAGGASLNDLRHMNHRHEPPAPGQRSHPANTIPARIRPSMRA
uniref:reverse transcriptase domain-containing protein n=1 Tax=Paraburkholderia heleia TaxID=634127 RepID=UPI002AB6E766|nr:reverse transcriptase domain-containing protein [Paraburkholderia heleia]